MRGLLFLLCLACAAVATADDLQATLDRHLHGDVPYWLNEPRLVELLRDASKQDADLDQAAVTALENRWRKEMAGDGGELSDHVASRFASNYLAEVALRLDGAYGLMLALDNRGLVTAASDLPDQLDYSADPCVQLLAQHPDDPWVEQGKPAKGLFTRVAIPVRDADGIRVGTLLLEIDPSRLPADRINGTRTRIGKRDGTSSVRVAGNAGADSSLR